MSSRSSPLSTLVLLALFGAASLHAVGSEDTKAQEHPLVGKTVIVQLRSGKTLKNVVVEEVMSGDIPDTISRLRILDPATGSRPILGASAVKRITAPDGKELLVFEEKSKYLAPSDEEKLAEIRRAAESKKGPSASGKPRPGRKAKPGTERKTGSGNDENARRKRNEQKRKEFFEKTGVWLWPELTDEQQKEALAKGKEYVAKIAEKFAPLNMRLYETRYYLFLSDLPPQVASLYTSCLDQMHERLCKAFGIKNKDGVWLGGKVPVVAFVHGEHFAEFERVFFNHQVNHLAAQGLAHQVSTGEVVISCHCGKDPYYFACVIVHEATHGFVHRYKSPQMVPNWLNEGIAEWVSMTVVQNNKGVRQKVKAAIEQMRQTGALGGDFFTAEHIASGQYGIATAMVDFMLRSNPKAFRAMIDGIKSGEKWQDALKKSYGVTPEELTQKFGMAVVGVPMLRP
ncbi:MAG: hypothetical protein KKE86_03440 [Planctomycetes bacterium]|nr:hypothetical protein [Planctomycetota bacterium]MCG2685619.1 hypothetical protein [Planctomycetales bacterium]